MKHTNLDVGYGWKRLLTVCVLRGECEETGDPQGDPGGNGLGLDPERDPGHDDNQTSGDVGVEQVVAETPLEHEDHLETGELAWKQDGEDCGGEERGTSMRD